MGIETLSQPFTNLIVAAPSSQDYIPHRNDSGNWTWVSASYYQTAASGVDSVTAGTNIIMTGTSEAVIVNTTLLPTFTTTTSTTFTTNVATANVSISGSTIAAGGSNANINTNIRAKGATGVVVLGDDGNDNWLAGATAFIPGADNTKDLGSASLGIRTAYINTTKTNKITELTALAGVTITTNSVDRWIFNASGAFNPYTDNTNDIGNHTVNPRDIHASRNFALKGIAAEGAGGWTRGYVTSSTTFTGGATENIAVQVPNNSKITGVLLRVDVDITFGGGGVSWSAAYNTGATQSITTGRSPAKNTKVKTLFDSNAASPITTAATDITITPDAGTLATGAITAVVFYESLTNLTDAA